MQRHGILPCVLVYSWNPEPRREAIISVLADSSSWAHPSSPPSPDTSHLHKISRWFLSPAVLINLRWGPRYYQVDKPCPLSPIQIPGPQNLYHKIFCIRRTWVWASSRSWWWTGEPGMLQSMGLQRVRQNWPTKLNWKRDHDGQLCTFISNIWDTGLFPLRLLSYFFFFFG